MLVRFVNDNQQSLYSRADLPSAVPSAAKIGDRLCARRDVAASYCDARQEERVDRNEDILDQELRHSLIQTSDLWLPSRGAVVRVPISSIVRVAADRDYARLYSSEDSFLLRATMSSLEKRLGPGRFVRIHRSTIIAIEQVAALRHVGNGAWVVIDRQGKNHAIGRHFLRSLRLRLELRPVENER